MTEEVSPGSDLLAHQKWGLWINIFPEVLKGSVIFVEKWKKKNIAIAVADSFMLSADSNAHAVHRADRPTDV